MSPEVMTDLVIHRHKGILIHHEASTDQAIPLRKGVMKAMEAMTGKVILHHLPVVVHLPVVDHLLVTAAAVTGLQEAAAVPATTLPLHAEEVKQLVKQY